jgi:predicted amidohydrolase YtcJ
VRFADLLNETARAGVTTLRICALGVLPGAEDIDLVRAAAGEAPPLRVRGALDLGRASGWRGRSVLPGEGDDMLRLDVMTACFDECRDANRGLADELGAAARSGWPIVLHVDRPEDVGASIDVLTSLRPPVARLDGRYGIECRSAPPSSQVARLRERGLTMGLTFPETAAGERSTTTGERDCDLSEDAPLSFGVDALTGPARPLSALSHAEHRDGRPLSRSAALRGVTLAAARRCGVGGILGSIEVGKYADFVFLDADPRRVPASEIEKIRCAGTWVAGREIRV